MGPCFWWAPALDGPLGFSLVSLMDKTALPRRAGIGAPTIEFEFYVSQFEKVATVAATKDCSLLWLLAVSGEAFLRRRYHSSLIAHCANRIG